MTMIVRDELIDKLKEVLKLTQDDDGVEALKIHIENASLALSREFDSLTTKTVDLTPSSGVVTFPDELVSIIGVWVGDLELQPIDFNEYQRLTSNSFVNDVIRIQEKAGNWTGTLSGANVSDATTVTLVYKTADKDISLFPDQYQRLVMLAVAADYYLYEDLDDKGKESKLRARFLEEMKFVKELQTHGQGKDTRRKSQFELDWTRSMRHLLVARDTDVS